MSNRTRSRVFGSDRHVRRVRGYELADVVDWQAVIDGMEARDD